VSRYNEATTPLWTGRRIIAKKRNRMTVSSIKNITRQTESDSIHATSTLRSASLTASTLASRRRKRPTISTIPTIPLMPDDSVASSPEILNIHNNLENSNDTKFKDPESHTTTIATLTNSVATPSVSTIIPMTNDSTTADILTFSNNPTTMIIPSVTNVSITTTSSTIAVAKAPAVATDATITTSATISAGVKTTLNYSVTDNSIIGNTNAILIDPTIPFAANTKTEITSTNVNIVPETTQTIATDPVTKSTVASTEAEITSAMTNYSITIPVTANAQEIATDSANITTVTITNADIGVTSTIENYTTIAIPTTINTNDVVTDSANLITATNAEDETSSMIRNYSIFTTTAIKNTTIPVTTTASPMVISSTMNTHIHATAPMITSNLANANTVTTNIMTMPFNVIIPTITDLNVITSTNANIPTATSEIPPTTIQSKTSSVTSSKAPVTVVTSVPTTLTTESSTIQLANPNTFNINNNSEMSAITATAESTQTAEIPTTFQTPLTFTSTATAFPKTLLSTNSEASSVTTATLSTQEDESFSIPMVIQTPSISSVISSTVPVMNTVTTSTSSASTTLATESSMIHLADSNNLNISNNSEILVITATTESTPTTEIPTTFEVLPTFTSTAFPKILPNTNFEASSVVTAALSTQEDESFSTPMVIIQTSSTPLSIVTSITNKTTGASEKSTDSTTLSTVTGESITISSTIRTTTNIYEPNSVQTISEKSIMPEQKTDFKKATSMETQSQTEDQITTTINKLSSAQTSNEFTIPEIKVSEEAISKVTKNQKQNQTLEFNTTNQFNQRTTRRRILNRTNNWLGSPITQRTNQYPQHRITYRERSRRPLTYISSSNMIEKNRKRRIRQKRIRINSEAYNSTIMPDQDVVVRNITENHAYDQIKNIRRKVVLKKKVEKETTTILPTEETTVFLQSSITIENKTFQAHHENENIEEQQKVILKKIKQSQESFATKETNTNSNSTNESFSDNTQSNLHIAESPSELENSKKIMKVILKNVRPKPEEKNPIEEVSADSDSININLQDNFSENSYTDKNLSDKRIAGKRMRVVLKSVRPKSEENSTIEETNVNPDSTNKNLQNNLLNNFNINQNFSNEEKTRKRTRVVLKRIKSEKETKTEEANTEYNSINETLQATFSNNFYSTTNLPIKYRTGRRMRVVLKSVKPKSEEKNSTIEKITVDSDSINESIEGTFSNNFRSGKNFPIEYGTRKRTRVVLKSVKPKSEKRNPSTVEETSIDSDSTDKDLQGSFSSNFHTNENFSDEEEARRRMEVVLKSIQTKSKEKDSIAEETSVDYNFARKDPQVLYTSHFSSNLHVGDNLLDKKKKHSKSEEEEAMTEWPEDTEPQTMETSVPVKEDTDRSLLEVSATLSRRSLP